MTTRHPPTHAPRISDQNDEIFAIRKSPGANILSRVTHSKNPLCYSASFFGRRRRLPLPFVRSFFALMTSRGVGAKMRLIRSCGGAGTQRSSRSFWLLSFSLRRRFPLLRSWSAARSCASVCARQQCDRPLLVRRPQLFRPYKHWEK
jgi:hypothetical protein